MNTEPVITAAVIYTIANSLIALARIMGWLDFSDEQVDAIMNVVELVAPFLLSIGGAYWARSKVTPVSEPRDNDGTELVRVDNKELMT